MYRLVDVRLKDESTLHTRPLDLHRVQGPGKLLLTSHLN